MKQFSLKSLQIIHFILLVTIVLLFILLRLILGSGDILLKGLSLWSSLIGSMWGALWILVSLIKDKNDPEQRIILSFYWRLLTNARFLMISNIAFFAIAFGLFAFMAVFQAVEFRTREPAVEAFLSSNDLKLKGPGYKSLGVITPDRPLKVRLPVGEKRFSFESLSDDKKKDAKIIRLTPFKMGNTYVYHVNLH